jgi:hypothetical protein
VVFALRVLTKIASAVVLVRSAQELFCVLVPKTKATPKSEKSSKVGLIHKTIAKTNIKVGHVHLLTGFFWICVPKLRSAQNYTLLAKRGLLARLLRGVMPRPKGDTTLSLSANTRHTEDRRHNRTVKYQIDPDQCRKCPIRKNFFKKRLDRIGGGEYNIIVRDA